MEQFEQYYRLPQDVVGHDAALLSYWDQMSARSPGGAENAGRAVQSGACVGAAFGGPLKQKRGGLQDCIFPTI